ncbi:hypothetical protein DITRI_Ditri03aG0102100 [Diplodiscus trichospermus]
MESGHVNGTDNQVANPSENGQVSSDNRSRFSSSPSLSSNLSGDAIQLSPTRTSTPDVGVSSQLKDKHSEDETQDSSMPNSGRSIDGSAMIIPATQAMEQSTGGSPLATSDKNRIPSSVFARTSTNAPAEWSVASNESLFSIQMGNMSFSKDQLSWTKSGELGFYTIDSTMTGPFYEVPSNQTPTKKSTEITKKSGNLKEGQFGVTEAAAETMREVLRDKECQHKENVAKESPRSPSLSRHSDASVKSFAFPILTGDADKSGSSTKNKKQPSQPSTPKTTAQTPSETSNKQTPQTSKLQSPPETPKQDTPKSQTPKATRDAGPKKRFSCFSCCPSFG